MPSSPSLFEGEFHFSRCSALNKLYMDAYEWNDSVIEEQKL